MLQIHSKKQKSRAYGRHLGLPSRENRQYRWHGNLPKSVVVDDTREQRYDTKIKIQSSRQYILIQELEIVQLV